MGRTDEQKVVGANLKSANVKLFNTLTEWQEKQKALRQEIQKLESLPQVSVLLQVGDNSVQVTVDAFDEAVRNREDDLYLDEGETSATTSDTCSTDNGSDLGSDFDFDCDNEVDDLNKDYTSDELESMREMDPPLSPEHENALRSMAPTFEPPVLCNTNPNRYETRWWNNEQSASATIIQSICRGQLETTKFANMHKPK